MLNQNKILIIDTIIIYTNWLNFLAKKAPISIAQDKDNGFSIAVSYILNQNQTRI